MMRQLDLQKTLSLMLITGLMTFTALPVKAEESEPELYIEEVIVTAQRRGSENLQRVPMSVSVISEDTIEKSGMVQMDDFLRALPSTNFLDRGAGRNSVVIRGVAADPQIDDTVGIYVGETPVTDMGTDDGSSPDLKLVDIQRIEVLRGPQGTLYGDGSMGGTVKLIPAPPNPSVTELLFNGSYGSTSGYGGGNSTIEAVFNVPVVKDESALRFVAYRHDNSGYYRNVAGNDPEKLFWAEQYGGHAINQDNRGKNSYTGGRIQFLWELSPNLKLTLMALTQDIDQTGLPDAELKQGDFLQSRYLKYDGEGESLVMDFDLVNALIEYDFRGHSLISTTSWVNSNGLWDRDLSFVAPAFLGSLPEYQLEDYQFRTWVQEFRLISRTDRRFQYLLGFFYKDFDSDTLSKETFEGDPALDPFNGGTLLNIVGDSDEKQWALFGNFSYDFTDQLSASFGARFFKYKQYAMFAGHGFYLGGEDSQELDNKDNGNTVSFNVDYMFNDSAMIYARFAQGFRLGGPHYRLPDYCDGDGDGLIDGPEVPPPTSIAPDDLNSLETGTKLSLAGGKLQLNATLFAVRWNGIPISVATDCHWVIQLNAGKAKSRGAEIEGVWAITPGVRVSFGASWVDPTLDEDAPGLGSAGDRLPGTPRYNLNLGIQGDFSIGERPAFARADLVYVGDYYNNLQQAGLSAGDYTTLALRGGLSFGQFEVELYVNNATNEFARTWFARSSIQELNYVIRPRTVGLQFRYSFIKH